MSDILIAKEVIDEAIQNNNTMVENDLPEGYKQSAYPFRPVKCTENDIKNKIRPANNFLYFTTDTKKIYLGQNNDFLPMCSSTGFYYGNKKIPADNSGNKPNPMVTFNMALKEIEGTETPEIDDLILNIDGCFYRVRAIKGLSIEAERLTLQGSGTGGSGGGEDVGAPNYSIVMTNSMYSFSSTADTLPVSFRLYYSASANNYVQRITVSRGSENSGTLEAEPFFVSSAVYPMDSTGYINTIDLIAHKNLFSTATQEFTITTYDIYNTVRSTTFYIQMVELSLDKISEDLIYTTTDQLDFKCKLKGATSTQVKTKEIICSFYEEDNLEKPIDVFTKNLKVSDQGEFTISINLLTDITKLVKGKVYILKVSALANLTTSIEPIYSNELIHKFAYYNNQTKTPMLMVLFPEYNEAYTNINMQYMIIHPDNDNEYQLNILVDNNETKTLIAKSNTIDSYNLYFENDKLNTYTITVKVPRLSLIYAQTLTVYPYTGVLPTTITNNLNFWLNPRGKSNNELDKNVWQDYRGNDLTSNALQERTAILEGVNYSNYDGWLTNENGINYLSLMSGATLKAPNFKPFATDPTNLNGFTVEIDFEITGTIDYDAEIIKCISYDQFIPRNPYVGFSITGNKARFLSSAAAANIQQGKGVVYLLETSLVEGKRTRLTFALEKRSESYPMAYTYLNGILSQAVIYADSELFVDYNYIPATLQIDSSAAQVKIYGIRFYNSTLTSEDVLRNYTASLDTLEERQQLFNDNNILSNNQVDFNLIADVNYQLGIPYMTLTGGYATDADNDKWRLKTESDAANHPNANPGLPRGKKDYRLVDVEVFYPKEMLDKGYKNYSFINVFENGKKMQDNFDVRPANGGAIMYAQGTSSMEYPIKNLRLRFKKESDWYSVRPDLPPVEIICMKADYMDSSGSHNTGAGNLIDAIYAAKGLKTPAQLEYKDENIVTCIKGNPCLIFYRETESDQYRFIGKYNLNLDKATPEPFGFKHREGFGYLPKDANYYSILYADKEEGYADPWVGQLKPTKGADYVPGQVETLATVANDNEVNSIHCFEFLDNFVNVCNFLPEPKAYIVDDEGNKIPDPDAGYWSYEDTWYKTFKNKEQEDVPGWTLGFESRYPEDRVGYHDADSLYPLASWINELYNIRVQEESLGYKPTEIKYEYRYDLATGSFDDSISYFIKNANGEYEKAYPNENDYNNNPGIYYVQTLLNSRFKMDSLERFKREYQCYFNKDFLITYYLITEALLMVDSRVKNMMLATWGREKHNYIDLEGNTVTPDPYKDGLGTYIFYPIFYDMDTMLGLDNTGIDRFDFYAEDTIPDVFNGVDILYNFVRDALSEELPKYFNNLESNSVLVANNILSYFNKNQADVANEAMYNSDAELKYLIPAREGYHDDLNNVAIGPGEAPYLRAAQGSRSLTREWWLTNRMRFLRGKYISGLYRDGDNVEFRWYYPSANITAEPGSDDYILAESAKVVPPNGIFDLASAETGYAGIMVGKNAATVTNVRFNGSESQSINVASASNVNGTEAYLLGLSNLIDLGDLSTKYMSKFQLKSQDELKLQRLQLGNSHRKYDNPKWRQVSSALNFSKCRFLEYFNMQNCKSYTKSIDLSGCSAIKQVLVTDSGITGLLLPENGMLEELRVSSSLTNLTLHSHKSLTKFSMGSYDYDNANSEDRIDNDKPQYYTNNYFSLSTLDVEHTPIDTYTIVLNAPRLQTYNLQGINWEITENHVCYCIVENNNNLDFENEIYYIFNGSDYIIYEGTSYPNEGKLYKQVSLLSKDETTIEHIPVLDYLYSSVATVNNINPAAALSGIITINMPGKTVNEYNIYTQYISKYPNVIIQYHEDMKDNIQSAYTINFYSQEKKDWNNDLEPYYHVIHNGEVSWKQLIGENSPAGQALINPSKDSDKQYDWHFKYWEDVETGTIYDFSIMDDEQKPPITTNQLNLVAVYEPSNHYYTINFFDSDGRTPIFTRKFRYDINNSLEYLMQNGQPIVPGDEDVQGDQSACPIYFHYKPYNGTLEHGRYALKGWISKQDFDNIATIGKPVFQDLTNINITDDLNLYAYYVEEDAQKVATDERCFNFSIKTISLTSDQKYYSSGLLIDIKPEYALALQGRITLPEKTIDGYDVHFISTSFNNCKNINEIYFLENSTYKATDPESVGLGKSVFERLTNLISIYLPEGFTRIHDYTFYKCTNLTNITLPNSIMSIGSYAFAETQISINELPNNLETLGISAFWSAGSGVKVTTLPPKLQVLPAYVFANCPNVNIVKFGSNDGSSILKAINPSCLDGAGENPKVEEIIIHSSVTNIKENGGTNAVFQNYGNLKRIISYKDHFEFSVGRSDLDSGNTGLQYLSIGEANTIPSEQIPTPEQVEQGMYYYYLSEENKYEPYTGNYDDNTILYELRDSRARWNDWTEKTMAEVSWSVMEGV